MNHAALNEQMPPEDSPADRRGCNRPAQLVGLLHLGQNLLHQEARVAVADGVVLDGAHRLAVGECPARSSRAPSAVSASGAPRFSVTVNRRMRERSPRSALAVLPHHQGRGRGRIHPGRSVDPVVGLHAVVYRALDGTLFTQRSFWDAGLRIGIGVVARTSARGPTGLHSRSIDTSESHPYASC